MILRALFRLFDRLMGGQWGCPHGPLGWLAGRLMARGNAAMNELALGALEAQAGDAVLEIGFGPGAALERICRLVGDGRVAGLDSSPQMLREATGRLRQEIAAGRVQLREGYSSAMPYPDASFGRVLTVNTLYFWEQPQSDLREIRRVLKPGGRFVMVFRAVEDEPGRLTVHGMPAPTSLDDVIGWMRDAEFEPAAERTREAPFGPETVTAVALTGTRV
ncbi:MAG: class I SAM-dependent methyltransferase [Dehalococcoidia bacterium]|nr:class I SAM-dependent methyltransferase [Dehalococcoidia bacterium]MDZ4278687.1 class I SAM-dependent methyltransferase [Dehalococcoidia bacterium]